MVRLNPWQWGVLIAPIVAIVLFISIAAGLQIHAWGLSWIWGIIILVFLGWRWLLTHWLSPPELEDYAGFVPEPGAEDPGDQRAVAAEAIIQQILATSRDDGPPWRNWPLFFQRAQSLVEAIAHLYAPDAKRPLLNIYVPQAYGLMRGTVDDVDRWMQKFSPVLGQVTIGQAYEAYETYQKLEPAARMALKAWQWAQWVLNPIAAATRTASQPYINQANQQLVVNLGQILRENTLKALGERAIALYSGQAPKPFTGTTAETLPPQTQSLREVFQTALPEAAIAQAPLQILVAGRTGAGKSSLINALFRRPVAAVDALPLTDVLTAYQYQDDGGESLVLWDAPGYEQAGRADYWDQVLAHAQDCDVLLLVTPAMDPALQMDGEFLQSLKQACPHLPAIAIVSQIDRLRPFREWEPPYDWREGRRPKEVAIREATLYRQELLGDLCEVILPCAVGETAWGLEDLSANLLGVMEPAKQDRLARFLRDRESRTRTAARIIERYFNQMSTTQGLTALLKSPILTIISTMMTGTPQLATILATQLPIEQAPVVLGKLQMAYDLFHVVADPPQTFDLQTLWPLALEVHSPIETDTWALGQLLVEYWLGTLQGQTLSDRYQYHLNHRERCGSPDSQTRTNMGELGRFPKN
jgi:predicted GTPase